MKYISVCSGIEAATQAWHPLGWEAVCFSEIEPFPCAVLAHHYPDVPNVGDMLTFDWKRYRGKADVVIGGTPCQSFSIAGLRDGLNDDRGNLTLKFVEVCNDVRPDFIVWENVPGVLSDKTNAFGYLLAGLVGADAPLVSPLERGRWTDAGMVAGPVRTAAWRVLDAQFFGLAQRRRRVFVIACPRNGANPSEILFEFKGVPGDTPKGRKTGEEIAGTIGGSSQTGGFRTTDLDNHGAFVVSESGQGYWRKGFGTYRERDSFDSVGGGLVAFSHQSAGNKNFLCPSIEIANVIQKNQGQSILNGMSVRRLTPREVERLFGFPDGYTNIPYGRPKYKDQICPDGHRYRALGNSMARNVIQWLGERIEK